MRPSGRLPRPRPATRFAGLGLAARLAPAMLVALVAILGALLVGCHFDPAEIHGTKKPVTPVAASTAGAEDPVARGKYLVTILACNDCHTPFVMGPNGPEPDMAKMLSGHPHNVIMPKPPDLSKNLWGWSGSNTNTAYSGPWGVSYATNLTPDETTGLGAWTEEIFVNTIRTGKHWGQSRPILPPMPWPSLKEMTDDDLKAVYAYLRTIPSIANQVPDPVIAPPPGS